MNLSQLHTSPVDYFIIATILVSALIGLVRGLMHEVVVVASWIFAVFGAWHFSSWVEPHLGGLMADSAVRPWAARVIVFLTILVIGEALAHLLGYFMRISIASSLDRFLGMLFGMARGILIVSVLTIVGQVLHVDDESWWRHSVLLPSVEQVAQTLRALGGERFKYPRHAALGNGDT